MTLTQDKVHGLIGYGTICQWTRHPNIVHSVHQYILLPIHKPYGLSINFTLRSEARISKTDLRSTPYTRSMNHRKPVHKHADPVSILKTSTQTGSSQKEPLDELLNLITDQDFCTRSGITLEDIFGESSGSSKREYPGAENRSDTSESDVPFSDESGIEGLNSDEWEDILSSPEGEGGAPPSPKTCPL
ncbi:MAG: hypothetical protein [Upsilontorquevirus procy7]|uniref:Uncharacterized protein n=1 Tax=Anelloviridae sp. TaxID=2055263 RepID=A0A3G2YSY2_9VIRU|nr:MAG: hypothetical protein QKC73_gp3 [Anelloviridae sp.]AYP28767.1 MAG: hypothetical protein [Anelloviridae sp.]